MVHRAQAHAGIPTWRSSKLAPDLRMDAHFGSFGLDSALPGAPEMLQHNMNSIKSQGTLGSIDEDPRILENFRDFFKSFLRFSAKVSVWECFRASELVLLGCYDGFHEGF